LRKKYQYERQRTDIDGERKKNKSLRERKKTERKGRERGETWFGFQNTENKCNIRENTFLLK